MTTNSKGRCQVSLCADDMVIYITDSKTSTRELLQLLNTFNEVFRYKINSVAPLYSYTNDKQAEKEIREITTFTTATNNTKYFGVTLTT